MGTIGDCYDNAPMEAFWGRMQVELLNRKKWITIVELSVAMADYICNFYNAERRHSSLGYLTQRIQAHRIIEEPVHTHMRVVYQMGSRSGGLVFWEPVISSSGLEIKLLAGPA